MVTLEPESSTEVRAAWRPPDDISGEIIHFVICYKDVSTGEEECEKNKTTDDGGTLKITLTDLNEATTYEVSVRAKTAAGYGPPGNVLTVTTLEASMYHYPFLLRLCLVRNTLHDYSFTKGCPSSLIWLSNIESTFEQYDIARNRREILLTTEVSLKHIKMRCTF